MIPRKQLEESVLSFQEQLRDTRAAYFQCKNLLEALQRAYVLDHQSGLLALLIMIEGTLEDCKEKVK